MMEEGFTVGDYYHWKYAKGRFFVEKNEAEA